MDILSDILHLNSYSHILNFYRTGSDKELIMPDRNTVLDGSKSHSPLGALSYFWELVEGKDTVALKNTNTSTLSVNGMDVGTYR